MLEISNLNVRYGAIKALTDVSVSVKQGDIVSLVGANGAGKSTLLNAISGTIPAEAGEIIFEGESLIRQSPGAIVRRGVIQIPEGRQVFANLTVRENLEMGAYVRGMRHARKELDTVFDLFPRLAERQSQFAGFMSGGEQQMLAIGRALMAGPRLLLTDEPSMGLAPLVIADMFRLLRRLNDALGITILLVEQNARAALRLSDRAYVLTTGQISRTGSGPELLADPEVHVAFLGRAARTTATPARMDKD